ncbi:hypothetical protein DIPPA_06434 [Diplonema papillatum]|nr:hypothetical protein DIPPA_06434 [Diplonema papillatum]
MYTFLGGGVPQATLRREASAPVMRRFDVDEDSLQLTASTTFLGGGVPQATLRREASAHVMRRFDVDEDSLQLTASTCSRAEMLEQQHDPSVLRFLFTRGVTCTYQIYIILTG